MIWLMRLHEVTQVTWAPLQQDRLGTRALAKSIGLLLLLPRLGIKHTQSLARSEHFVL